jgi:hypothetical protein
MQVAPLTLEEHRDLGNEMRRTSARLRELCSLVVEVYGSQSQAGNSFLQAVEAIEQLRQDMEDQGTQDLMHYGALKLYL